jgi:hypothetical protein
VAGRDAGRAERYARDNGVGRAIGGYQNLVDDPGDTYQVIAPRAEPVRHSATAGEPSFTAAIRHINAVLAGEDEPRLLAADTALPTAQALHDLALSFTARAAVPGG